MATAESNLAAARSGEIVVARIGLDEHGNLVILTK
jgi:hypothetical protein